VPEREADHLMPLVERVHAQVRPASCCAAARVSFYPYVDAKSIVREREGRIHLRLSDHLAAAPDQVLEGSSASCWRATSACPTPAPTPPPCARTSSTSTTPAP